MNLEQNNQIYQHQFRLICSKQSKIILYFVQQQKKPFILHKEMTLLYRDLYMAKPFIRKK